MLCAIRWGKTSANQMYCDKNSSSGKQHQQAISSMKNHKDGRWKCWYIVQVKGPAECWSLASARAAQLCQQLYSCVWPQYACGRHTNKSLCKEGKQRRGERCTHRARASKRRKKNFVSYLGVFHSSSLSGVTMREKKAGTLQKLKKRLSHSFGRLCKSNNPIILGV